MALVLLMHLRCLLLFSLFLPGPARRNIRMADSHHDEQQLTNTFTNALQVSTHVREALIPRGFGKALFPGRGPEAGSLRTAFRAQHGQPVSMRDGGPGARRATLALNAAGGPEENQTLDEALTPRLSKTADWLESAAKKRAARKEEEEQQIADIRGVLQTLDEGLSADIGAITAGMNARMDALMEARKDTLTAIEATTAAMEAGSAVAERSEAGPDEEPEEDELGGDAGTAADGDDAVGPPRTAVPRMDALIADMEADSAAAQRSEEGTEDEEEDEEEAATTTVVPPPSEPSMPDPAADAVLGAAPAEPSAAVGQSAYDRAAAYLRAKQVGTGKLASRDAAAALLATKAGPKQAAAKKYVDLRKK